jgi:hypothetical protein
VPFFSEVLSVSQIFDSPLSLTQYFSIRIGGGPPLQAEKHSVGPIIKISRA